MICKVRETEGGYRVTLFTAEAEIASRVTPSLAEAFEWQAYAAENGELPPYKKERKK